jgi:ribosomal protein L11 methyltransferase
MKYLKVDFNIKHTYADVFNMQDARDLIAAIAGEIGFESFEDSENGIIGYVQESLFNLAELKIAIDDFPIDGVEISFNTTDAEYKNWNSEWEKKGYEPIIIDDRCIVHDTKHPSIKKYPIDIIIDAKQAFGTGTHQTTRMIIRQLINMNLSGKALLDCGCGTGILSFAGIMCGAASAVGYDIDEWSTVNAKHNAEINNVKGFNVLLGDSSLLSNKITGPYDVVIANINRNILQADMPSFVSVMNHKAKLILSGFYEKDAKLLETQAETLGMKLDCKNIDDNWCCIVLEKL